MKIEDLVKVVKLDKDDQVTNLSIGDTGIVKSISGTGDVIDVDFGDMSKVSYFSPNRNSDGTYQMWREQLQVVKSEEL